MGRNWKIVSDWISHSIHLTKSEGKTVWTFLQKQYWIQLVH